MGLEVGIFGALHTYGRGLNWQPTYFKKKHVEYHWRRNLIDLLRRKYDELNLSTGSTEHIQDYRQ